MEPFAVVTTIFVLGIVVKSVIDGLRRQYPRLDGLIVQAIAVSAGFGLAWAFDLRGAEALLEYLGGTAGRTPHYIVDWVITGAAIAAGAGFFAEIAGRSGKTGTVIEIDAEGRPVL